MSTYEAFCQIIVALLPRLRRFCRALTGNPSDADDLAQATIEKAMRNMERFRENGPEIQDTERPDTGEAGMARWLFTIAHNHWRDDRRSSRVRAPHVDYETLSDMTGEDGTQTQERRSQAERIQAAVASLQPDQRDVVALVLVEGFAYREAAEILDVPIGTVMSRLARARAALSTLLADERPQ